MLRRIRRVANLRGLNRMAALGSAPTLAAALVAGCAPPVASGGFDAPDPASRIYAAQRAAMEGDQSAVPHIVELLDSDDPAVRFTAIAALERLTGTTLGYDYSASPAERRAAIARWVQYVIGSDFTTDGPDGRS